VVIAAAAVRLVHHLDLDFYNRLTEIIVYPTHYHHKDNEDSIVYGEAHAWGTVVLSWEAVLNGLHNPTDGHDTATHEFAHVLDRVDGSFDGTPELRASEHYRAWSSVMTEHYTKLRAQEEATPSTSRLRCHQRGRVFRGSHGDLLREAAPTQEANARSL
jgi:Mlc titration factor MtfA (ptsG expression regulator)